MCGHAHICTNRLVQTTVQFIINPFQHYVSMFFFYYSLLFPSYPPLSFKLLEILAGLIDHNGWHYQWEVGVMG